MRAFSLRYGAALVLLALCLPLAAKAADFRLADRKEWRDARVTEVNKQPPYASHFPFDDAAQALRGDPAASWRYLLLNGEWRFKWAADPAHAPSGFWAETADVSSWDKIPVPGDWVRSGYGRYQYVDEDYLFPLTPPNPPESDNPVGSYVRDIDIPQNWSGQSIFLHFGSVRTGFYVWLNGKLVGFSEDSRLPAEFDVTALAHPGRNRLALQVLQWPVGAYLEDQDMWRMAGIERDVYAYAAPPTQLRDFFIHAGLDAAYRDGTLAIEAEATGPAAGAASLTVTVRDGDKTLLVLPLAAAPGGGGKFSGQATLAGIEPWSAETPRLYDALFELRDKNGVLLEATANKIGFRMVELRGGQLLVNGRPIFIKGVNRQEFEADTMHVISAGMQRRDLELMKQYNINAIRLSHSPNDEILYRLADEMGFYLVDEANIESHGAMNAKDMLADRPEFWNAHHARMVEMVERDKNHPSVIIWSLGNEAGSGKAFADNYRWTHERDPSRPVQYEAAGDVDYTDIYVPMYAKPWDIQAYLVKKPTKPLILCEFAHMMGNSGGALKTYRELFYVNRQFQGGFVWDWVDQSLKVTKPDGSVYYGYGGDFVADNIEYSFADGLMSSLRQPRPQLFELKKTFEPLTFTAPDLSLGRVHLASHFDFRDTANLSYRWRIDRNGKPWANGTFSPPILAARTEADAAIDLPSLDPSGGEYFLTVEARLSEAQGPLPAGHLLAFEQFPLQGPKAVAKAQPVEGKALQVRDGADELVVEGGRFSLTFDKKSGSLARYEADGHELLAGRLRPDFWRAMTDNDLGADLRERLGVWHGAGDGAVLEGFDHRAGPDGSLIVTARLRPLDGATLAVTHEVRRNGDVAVAVSFDVQRYDLPVLPRLGMRFEVPAAFDRLDWYGRGPHSNYSDRYAAAPVGLYGGSVAAQYDDYVRPQESGNKIDLRYMALRQGQTGPGLLIVGDPTFSGGALPYSTEDLDQPDANQKHAGDLVPRDRSEVHVDMRQMGLGGDDSWRSTAHAEFLIWPRAYAYRFVLAPLADHDDAGARARGIAGLR